MNTAARRRSSRILIVLALIGVIVLGAWRYRRMTRPKRFQEVDAGKLYRSRQPRGMQYAVLDHLNIGRVISLRHYTDEPVLRAVEAQRCREAGVEFVQIAVDTMVPSKKEVLEFLRAVRTAPGPVLVHCQYGRDRTGQMCAAYRVLVQEWSVDDALEEIASFRANLESEKGRRTRELLEFIAARRKQWLARSAVNPTPTSTPSEAVLEGG